MSAAAFGEIAEQLRRSTVQVRVDGGIVSCAHVVTGPDVEIEFWDGEKSQATVLRRDTRRDLALLCVNRANMPVPKWADSSRLCCGEAVVAVGNPLGFVGALSTGVVHAVGPLRGVGNQNWVQATIRLAPGNSGGALANSTGEVIGINAMVAGELGLAMPSNEVVPFVERVLLPTAPPILGITVEPVELQVATQRAVGLRIQHLEHGGRGQLASLLPGDVIIGSDGEYFFTPDDLTDRLSKGGLVHLEFLRNGKPAPREVVIALAAAA